LPNAEGGGKSGPCSPLEKRAPSLYRNLQSTHGKAALTINGGGTGDGGRSDLFSVNESGEASAGGVLVFGALSRAAVLNTAPGAKPPEIRNTTNPSRRTVLAGVSVAIAPMASARAAPEHQGSCSDGPREVHSTPRPPLPTPGRRRSLGLTKGYLGNVGSSWKAAKEGLSKSITGPGGIIMSKKEEPQGSPLHRTALTDSNRLQSDERRSFLRRLAPPAKCFIQGKDFLHH
jgi:hypothetical protein